MLKEIFEGLLLYLLMLLVFFSPFIIFGILDKIYMRIKYGKKFKR